MMPGEIDGLDLARRVEEQYPDIAGYAKPGTHWKLEC
jgi:hypothetical protein